jgi:hypothetical protein
MPTTPDMKTSEAEAGGSPSADLANILSELPRHGAEDDLARVLEVYEAAERRYRASTQAGKPVIGASTSANR